MFPFVVMRLAWGHPLTQHGPWQILGSHEVYRDPWLSLRRDEVIRPDGLLGTYSVVHLKPGVTVLALDGRGHVFLAEEFHYAVGQVTIEAVSGGIEVGEDPQETARRELREELGIFAARWTDLGRIDPFTGSVCSPAQLFLAEEISHGSSELEGTETIRKLELPLADAVEMVMQGRITHAPSVAVILKCWLRRQEHGRGSSPQ